MSKLPTWCVLGLVLALGCKAKPHGTPAGGASAMRTPGPGGPGTAGHLAAGALGDPGEGPMPAPVDTDAVTRVGVAPATASEVALPDGATPLDVAASPTRAEAVVLLQDASGAHVVSWTAGSSAISRLADLASGFTGRAIAVHPSGGSVFVVADSGGKGRILRLDRGQRRFATVYVSPLPIEHLVVGPRPFVTGDGRRYRLFFATRLASGDVSLRSVTDAGTIEYQVVGLPENVVRFPDLENDEQPANFVSHQGSPLGFHARGEPLLWQDERGCAHLLPYDEKNWGTDRELGAVPCGSTAIFAPNGAAFLAWQKGVPGVAVVREAGLALGRQATSYSFLAAPAVTPDGRGLLGIVSKGGARTAIAYAPIQVPLANVANAWQLSATACDERLFVANAGLFRERPSTEQLYSLYDTYDYGSDYPPPLLVTTDLLWENFGAAFNGAFILLERRQAVPAFQGFVTAANAALARTSKGSRWAHAFAVLAAVLAGDQTGEAGLIARAAGPAQSTVLDTSFDFSELTPRGHYSTTPDMRRYFGAMRYLTAVSRVLDPAAYDSLPRTLNPSPLDSLPADVQQRALDWIRVYRPFIAAPRSRLLWQSGAGWPSAPYAKHPWLGRSVFPLSWGIDNEVLESTVYHDRWPPDEQIAASPLKRRLNPSGVDVAAMYGSPLARSLLDADFATYPRLKPVLDAITARRPALTASSSLYDRWLDALGVEWADSSAFPGVPPASPVWPAKRLQTGLASWATLREATILVTERPEAAEAGEGGFEELVWQQPRGYVEPAPRTFEAIAGLFDALAADLAESHDLGSGAGSDEWKDEPLRQGILRRLAASAVEARRFAAMARKELRGEALADSEYDAIRAVGGSAEHQFLIYKSLAEKDLALSVPDPLPRIADVAGSPKLGILEVAVGGPLEWDQIVPFFGRSEIAIGSVYSYYELRSQTPYTNERWRSEVDKQPRPAWIQPLIAPPKASCTAASR